ncbi:hypothetical protein ACTQ33_08600 [Candidatus Avoscillospira sp. LCP25S3_F1]|uniref:hypothetical protein n=1 Tax=Candidatus Avoscillospira sp. LCP25S3_F1 TaxID=3438825 RepID=UPI003F90D955
MQIYSTFLFSLGVIGGADGPTAVFVAGQTELLLFVLALVGIAVLIVLVVRFLRRRK